MRYLLALLFVALIAGDVFGWTQSIAPGMSLKNAFLYLAALMLAARIVIRGGFKLEVPGIQLWFGVLIGYAILTWLTVGLLLHYQSYNLIATGIALKSQLVDDLVIFLLCLYGVQSVADVRFVIRWLLCALTCANVIAIGDIAGWFQIGVTMVGREGAEAGRAMGAFGHANETAALIVCLLPAYAAVAITSRGATRVFWIAGALISASMMLMTGSRGAFVGLLLGGIFGWYTCRRLISFAKAVPLLVALVVLAVPVLLLVNLRFGSIFTDRVIEMFQDPAIRSGDRTSIWMQGISRMMDHPLSLLTGFGWDAYSVMGFFYATHNYYLLLWFELGVIGVVSYLLIIQTAVVTARSAAAVASPELRAHLVAFIFGIYFVSVAMFFSLVFKPWLYIWAYIGLAMRLAVIAMADASEQVRTQGQRAAPSTTPALRRTLPKNSLSLRSERGSR